MIMATVALMVAILAAAPPTSKMTYEAFSVGGPSGRQLIVRGIRTYTACDILVDDERRNSRSMTLRLEGNFAISASVYREPKLTGFGLVLERPDSRGGFSWDWFDLEQGNVFQKRQGPGRVAVELGRGDGWEELHAVEFLDDVTLRYRDDMSKPPGTHTHELVVRKGSVLRLAALDSTEPPCPAPERRSVAPPDTPKSGAPAPEPKTSASDIQLWLTYYYLKPRPETVLPSLDALDREMQKAGRSLADEIGRGGLRSFYARVFAENDAVVKDVDAKLPSWPAGHQAFVKEALRRCGSPACTKALGEAPGPVSAKAVDPTTLDDAWASFFATGDSKYVHEVIDVLPWSETRGDVDRLLTGGAARWSLASNAYQHSRVLAILEERALAAPEPTKRMLREIIEGAKAERAKTLPPEPPR